MLRSILALSLATSSAAFAQARFAELGVRHLPELQGSVTAIAAGDFDADGDLDLVTCRWSRRDGRRAVHLLWNQGDTWGQAQRLPYFSGTDFFAAMTRDFDGDGAAEIVLGHGRGVSVLRNNGSGSFSPSGLPLQLQQHNSTSLASADVDGDGDEDLVIGLSAERNRLFLNDGAARFTEAPAGALPNPAAQTTSVALFDADGDGDADLLCGTTLDGHNGAQDRLYLNDGSGRFTDGTAGRLPAAATETDSFIVFDSDGDGDQDVFRALRGPLGGPADDLLLGDGTGTFTEAPSGSLPPLPTDGTWGRTLHAEALDADGDSDLDLVVVQGWETFLLLNSGAGRFQLAPAGALPKMRIPGSGLVAEDLDGDGFDDLLSGANSEFGTERLLLGAGTGVFVDANAHRFGARVHGSFLVGDLDGDGFPDLLRTNYWENIPAELEWHRGDGSGGFSAVPTGQLPVDQGLKRMLLADLDGDGDKDLLLAYLSPGRGLRLLENDGRGGFTDVSPREFPGLSATPQDLATADVDGDGDLDIVFSDYRSGPSGNLRVLLRNSSGGFVEHVISGAPGQLIGVDLALGDVDADGIPDLVVSVPRSAPRVLIGDGRGNFLPAPVPGIPVATKPCKTIKMLDIDADGDLDLVMASAADTDQNVLLVNDGSGTFTDETASRLPALADTTRGLSVGDLDQDGAPDLLVVNERYPGLYGTIGCRLLVNDGAGVFHDRTTELTPWQDRSAVDGVVSDLDRDGDADLVLGMPRELTSVWSNLRSDIDAPRLFRVGREAVLEIYAQAAAGSLLTVAAPFLSPVRTTIPVPGLGILGIDPSTAAPLQTLLIAAQDARAWITLPVPADSALIGAAVHAQAALLDWPGSGARLTGTLSTVIHR